jgi:hypothetical protein
VLNDVKDGRALLTLQLTQPDGGRFVLTTNEGRIYFTIDELTHNSAGICIDAPREIAIHRNDRPGEVTSS